MTRARAATLVLAVACAGCVDRARVNVDCRWVHEAKAFALDLGARANREHLDDDARFAEDLAIRFADVQRGHRSGHFKGIDEYERARDQCMTALFEAVAQDHRVTRDDVRAGLEHRRTDFDAIAILVFFILYGLAAIAFAQWMFRTFLLDRTLALIATVVVSAPFAVAGWAAGGLWSSALEMIRIGNDHLSYRGERAPWSRHSAAAFAACVAVFWLASVWRYRSQRREESPWQEQSASLN
jgi:hypothetical protein